MLFIGYHIDNDIHSARIKNYALRSQTLIFRDDKDSQDIDDTVMRTVDAMPETKDRWRNISSATLPQHHQQGVLAAVVAAVQQF